MEQYRTSLHLYRQAVLELDESLSRSDFIRIHEHAERSRLAFDRAREALQKHIVEHGC
jgi:hypothetical protein